jgi:hypothetical protein
MILDTPAATRLKALQEQRDAADAEIQRILQKEAKDECAPIREELLSLRPKLEARGAWPCALIIDFHFGNTWLHANEAHLYFSEQISCYRQSSSGGGGRSSYWTMPGVLEHFMREYPQGSVYEWNSYFKCDYRYCPNSKQLGNTFKPFDRTECWIGQSQDVGRVFFYQQVSCCPMCGFVDRNLKPSNCEIKRGEYGNDWQWPDKLRNDQYKLKTLLAGARAILSGELFDNGAVFKRCETCRNLSYLDNWRRIYKRAKESLRDRDSEYSARLLQNIESIWPDKFGVRAQVKTSIFRQAKKRARIKPLSRGELAFFSMHLAASQVKELKATNRTHDTNKILNQAN